MNSRNSKAAAYVRASTDQQNYSISNQLDMIRLYASKNNLELVKVYSDDGKSGLSLRGRTQLAALIKDVTQGSALFETIIVYDISRWGRFQDADESAYYEYICRLAGISVVYCAEQFNNDGSLLSNLLKSLKRAMAGEYSRELSAKVLHGSTRLVREGFRQGGPAPYGLRRLLFDEHGNPKHELKRGQHKSIQSDRIRLIPGPAEEIAVVNQIFEWFASEKRGETEIANILNQRGVRHSCARGRWNKYIIRNMLSNEHYIGHLVYCRTAFKLQLKRVAVPEELWVRCKNAHQAIVPLELFQAVQRRLRERFAKPSDAEIIACLRNLLREHSKLSVKIIDGFHRGLCDLVARRFGSLTAAYDLVGYEGDCSSPFLMDPV